MDRDKSTLEFLHQLLRDRGWKRDKKLDEWADKVVRHMSHHTSISVVRFQLEEICHYLSEEDVNNKVVPLQNEHKFTALLYKEMDTTTAFTLQTPDETFGEHVDGTVCVNCKKTNVISMAIQKRSPDEPTSYFHQCPDCNARWKDR
jgi:DNA-directed RNA polymerase subunit M/transcription elongation factor TFIIS